MTSTNVFLCRKMSPTSTSLAWKPTFWGLPQRSIFQLPHLETVLICIASFGQPLTDPFTTASRWHKKALTTIVLSTIQIW